jgi:hypothetical protein
MAQVLDPPATLSLKELLNSNRIEVQALALQPSSRFTEPAAIRFRRGYGP